MFFFFCFMLGRTRDLGLWQRLCWEYSIKSYGTLSLGFIVLRLLAPWQGFQRARPLSKLPPSPPFLGSAVDAKVSTGILTGCVDHSAGVGERLRCSDVIIGGKFPAGPSVDILGQYRYIVTPCRHVLLKLGNSVVCTNLRKGKYLADRQSLSLFVVNYIQFIPIPLGAWSKAWVLGLSLARVVLPSVVCPKSVIS